MKNKKITRLAIICGGTGGHFYPGLTIARAFQKKSGCKAFIFIGGHKINSQVQDAVRFNIHIEEVDSARISKHPIKLLIFLFKFLNGYIKAGRLLKKTKPDAVLAMGSFTSIPVSLAAVRLKIPLFLHDGNARVGRANIFLSKWSKLIMTAFPPVNSDSLKCEYSYTGMPIRPEITSSKLNKPDSLKQLNTKYNCEFDNNVATVLIFGGSQGAATINRVLPKAISKSGINDLQIIHLIGKNDLSSVTNEYEKSSKKYLVLEYCDDMALLYSAADLVICRSGGSTVAELSFFNKPAILIPYPLAADLHQNDNAEFYKKSGLAEIVLNSECTEERMAIVIKNHLNNICSKKDTDFTSLKKLNISDKIIELIDNKILIN